LGNLQNLVQDGEVVSLILLISRFQAIGTTTHSKFVEKKKHKGVGDHCEARLEMAIEFGSFLK
jgi:hypothetical protein